MVVRSPRALSSDINIFVPPEIVFPGITVDERTLVQLLSTLNRNETVIACSRANAAVSGYAGPDHKQQQERMINDLLPRGSADRINAFINEHQLRYAPPIFFRGQLLELMRWTVKHAARRAPDPNFYEDVANREKFAQAALIAGMLWSKRIYAKRLQSSGDPDYDRLRALGPFRKGVEESSHAPNQAQTLGRGWLLFTKHMPRRYRDFAARFQEATGLSVEQYIIITAGLTVFTKADADPLAMFSAANMAGESTYQELVPRYLALESQDADTLARGLWGPTFASRGYRALRERPLLAGLDDRMVIADPIFLSEKISIGPLFHVIGSLTSKKANEVFGAFGLAFEDYAGDILDRMYPTRPGLVPRLSRNVEIDDLEIDAVLDGTADAAFFEMKAAWLREDAILDDSPARLMDNLMSLYGISGRRGERPKGVAQLARIINALFSRPNAPWAQRFAHANVIYPVLLVHDTNLSTPAPGHRLNIEFQKLLNEPPKGKRVAPLIVMTIDDLEKLESSVANFSLRDLIAAYDAAASDRIQNLHNFAVRSPFALGLVPNQSLIETSKKVIDAALRELFPEYKDVPSAAL